MDSNLGALVDEMLASYQRDSRGKHINRRYLPSRDEIIEALQLLLQLFFPGYYGRQDLTDENISKHVEGLLAALQEKLFRQIETCMCFQAEASARSTGHCGETARIVTTTFLNRLPSIRDTLLLDVQAAYDGDPAASSLDEVILAYPGLLAISVHRIAHELFTLNVPLMPRIMSEWAHSKTGTDIHPGAQLGKSFFIDHGTGVVVGETTHIGANVKLYQGVTLGALSHPRDARGRVIRGSKRHPTVQDNVTVYANATVLGGDTVLGADSVVGGSVFITKSVPPGSRIAMKAPELSVRGSSPQMYEFEI